VAGQSITLVANGVNFTGGYPLFDVIFAMSTRRPLRRAARQI
jgi:hypothetical protein